MRAFALKTAIEIAQTARGPIGKIIASAVEVGVIVPSILRAKLKEAGYVTTYHSGPGEHAPQGPHPHGAWVQVRLPQPGGESLLVARAYSEDETDALLQAVVACMKEEQASRAHA